MTNDMTNRFLDPSERPPGGWRFLDLSFGEWIQSTTLHGLVEAFRAHLTAHKLPVPDDLSGVVQEMLCSMLPPMLAAQYCRWPGEANVEAVEVEDVLTFLSVLARWIKTGEKFVDISEAVRRAAICAQCPQNVRIAGCTPCHDLISNTLNAVMGRNTPLDHFLRGCAICHCSNRAQIHIPLEVLHAGMSKTMGEAFPQWCWKKPAFAAQSVP